MTYVKSLMQYIALFIGVISLGVSFAAEQSTANNSSACSDSNYAHVKTGVIYDDAFLSHNPGDTHPESAARVSTIMKHLRGSKIWPHLQQIPVRSANDDELELVHTRPYLDELQTADKNAPVRLDADTVLGSGSLAVAKLGVGASLQAVDAVMSSQTRNVFVVSRPPGHHAFPDRASGFCIFNNVAVAARYAQASHEIERVLIVDWDVHHGNATQDTFYEDGTVMYFSTHQYPHYPQTGLQAETGSGSGFGTNFNVPLSAGSGGREVLDAYKNILLPAAQEFKPQLVLVSAGFDSHAGDPLANFQLTADDFREMTRIVRNIADEHSNGRLVSVLEGGYQLNNLAVAVETHIDELMLSAGCRQ